MTLKLFSASKLSVHATFPAETFHIIMLSDPQSKMD